MKAVLFHAPGEPLRVEELPIPRLEAGDALLQVELCGVCASDLMALDGLVSDYSPPVVLGHEIAARIVEGGNAGLPIGTRVSVNPMMSCGECAYCRRDQDKYCAELAGVGHDFDGGFAEYVRIPGRLAARGGVLAVPPDVPPESVLFVEPLGCVLNALDETACGDSLAVLGAGPIGLLFVLVARSRGIPTFVLEPMAHRRETALALGAGLALSPDAQGYAAVRDATAGGADAVMVATDHGSAFEAAFAVVRRGGAINFFGLSPKGRTLTLELEQLHFQGYRILASWAFSRKSLDGARRMIANRAIDSSVLVTGRFPLSGANEAVRHARERRGVKIVLDPTYEAPAP
jgi:L-iditol 2-dehydrogenase